MTSGTSPVRIAWKELVFQIVLHALVFIFYSVDRRDPQITMAQGVFFLNYALIAGVINYIFLPRFYYRKRYLHFAMAVLLIILAAILVEEFVLEQIFFPDTRGQRFSAIFYTMADVLPVMVILTGFKFAWDALGKQREVDALKSVVKESELQFLKSQINPHFLFNNLNNLYAYAIENSPKTPDIILELSGVLRYMLYECKEKYVLLSKEVEQLRNFVGLHEMQIEKRGQVSFTADPIPPELRIAPLILVVFIENAFKHSTASQSENIVIAIDVRVSHSGSLRFYCKNSYQPQSNTDDLTHGIGLENVKKRLQLIYPAAHELKITEGDGKYEVFLRMELNVSGQV